jgi:hypothetical protein
MTKASQIPWAKVAIEAAAIVGSILLAFAIDAWWEDSQSEQQEAQILEALLEDLVTKRDRLESQRTRISKIRASANSLLQASAEGNDSLDSGSIDILIGDICVINQPASWSFPLLRSIVEGGQLVVISNIELRTMLVDWHESFALVQAAVARDLAFYDVHLIPFLNANVSMPQILNASRQKLGLSYKFDQEFSLKVKTDHTDLLTSKEFQGLVSRRSILLNDILLRISPDFGADLDTFIEVIRAELQ